MEAFNLGVLPIPPEITEQALTLCHPRDVSAFSRTCRSARSLVYGSPDQYLWRQLFLRYPFDDPRISSQNKPETGLQLNWRYELQRRVQAESIALHAVSRPQDIISALEVFVHVVRTALPVTRGRERQPSQSLMWVVRVLQESNLLWSDALSQQEEADQLVSRLRSYLSLTLDEGDDPDTLTHLRNMRTRSRCCIYDLRNYGRFNDWGPYTESREVNWAHVEAIINVMLMNLGEFSGHWMDTRPPNGLEATRAYSAPGATTRAPEDWACIEGTWRRFVCFMDYRDLFAFNFSSRARGPRDPSFFEDPNFQEATRLIELKLHLIPFTDIPTYYTLDRPDDSPNPKFPTLYFSGTSWGVHGNEATVVGSVCMGGDGIVRWRFASIYDSNMQWSSEGVQVGNVASAAGIVGTWTGAHHEHGDPVGPFWLWKVRDDHPSYMRTIEYV